MEQEKQEMMALNGETDDSEPQYAGKIVLVKTKLEFVFTIAAYFDDFRLRSREMFMILVKTLLELCLAAIITSKYFITP